MSMNPNMPNLRKTRRDRGGYSQAPRSFPKGPRSNYYEKAITNKGVYANSRMTHATTALLGCPIKVQVKNGAVYAGVFKTFSENMDIVVELAHRLDEGTGGNPLEVPSKERLVDKIVFKCNDIVDVTAQNVDLDFANKDNFTDAAISKFNGQASEREMKELTPWDPENETTSVGLEEASSSPNGWDASDMFKTNERKFDVKSSYDPSLEIYTTPLTKQNTKEYQEREAVAAKLAREIEGSDTYKRRIALENGEGDEEQKFSAVHGSSDQSSGGKYVPPHMRRGNVNQGRPRPAPHTPKQNIPTDPAEGKLNGDDRKVAEVVVTKGPTLSEAPTQNPNPRPQEGKASKKKKVPTATLR